MQSLSELMQEYGMRVNYNNRSQLMPLHTAEDMQQVLFYSKTKDQIARERLICTPMDEEWKKWCEKEWWFQEKQDPNINPKLYQLRARLLSFAGESTCLPIFEDDIENILQYGQFWLGHNAKMMRGEPGQCHRNSANLWESNKNNKIPVRICTGYALSEDGMWRQHSWLIWKPGRNIQIIETTKKRVAYYGFVLSDEIAQEFAINVSY